MTSTCTSGVSNSNGLGGRIRSVQVFAGRIQSMQTSSGPHESLIESLINYIMIQYLNKQKKLRKNQLNYSQTVEKTDFFVIFIQFTVFDNCWGAAMDPLAGRVFEVPGLNYDA